MAYMKVGIAKYKEENPGVAHKEAFSKVCDPLRPSPPRLHHRGLAMRRVRCG